MAQPQLAPGTPETPDLSPTGGRSELLPQRSRTPDTDGLRSGGNVVLVGPNEPFWEERTAQVLSPAKRGDGRRSQLGVTAYYVPLAPVGNPAGDYRIEVPSVDAVYPYSPQGDPGSLVETRDYFTEPEN